MLKVEFISIKFEIVIPYRGVLSMITTMARVSVIIIFSKFDAFVVCPSTVGIKNKCNFFVRHGGSSIHNVLLDCIVDRLCLDLSSSFINSWARVRITH